MTTMTQNYTGALLEARILIVDDEVLTSRSLERVLRGLGARPETYTSLESARQAIIESDLPFDAAVVDYQLVEGRGHDGLEIIRMLRTGRYPCAALMITGSHDPDKGKRALEAGADDFLLKPFDPVDFVKVLEGIVKANAERRRRIAQTPYNPYPRSRPAFQHADPLGYLVSLGPDIFQAKPAPAVPNLDEQVERIVKMGGLSKRERQVLVEILRGHKNMDISATLGITTRTVKFHVRNVLKKCGVSSRTGLTALLWDDAHKPPTSGDSEDESRPQL